MATLRGYFYDEKGTPINGAAVEHWYPAADTQVGAATGSTTTNVDGKWEFTGVTAGLHDVRLTSGTNKRWIKGKTIPVGQLGLDNLPQLPTCHVTNGSDQAILIGPQNVLAFTSERYDTDTMHDNAVNNSRLTCVTAGKYRLTAQASFSPDPSTGSGTRQLAIIKNAGIYLATHRVAGLASAVTNLVVTTEAALTAGDYVQVHAYCDGVTGPMAVAAQGDWSPEFIATYITS